MRTVKYLSVFHLSSKTETWPQLGNICTVFLFCLLVCLFFVFQINSLLHKYLMFFLQYQ